MENEQTLENQEPVTEEVVEETVDNQEAAPEPEVDNAKLNFEALRKAKKQAEKERDELARKLKELEALKQESQPEDDLDYADDEVETVKKEINTIKKTLEQERFNNEVSRIEKRLQQEFPDIEEVINEKNIEVLKARDPEFAKIVSRPPSDPSEFYHRALTAYTLINKYGIAASSPEATKNAERLQNNMNKPKSSSAAATSKSDALSELSQFADLPPEERRRAIIKLARERAGL